MEFKNGDMLIRQQTIAKGYLSSPITRRRIFSTGRRHTNKNTNKINELYDIDFIGVFISI